MAVSASAWRAAVKPHKYHARRTVVDGVSFASQAEALEYRRLVLGVRAGVVRDLTLQPVFELHAPTGEVLGKYLADFAYTDAAGRRHVVDVKGFQTPVYKWKKKHVQAEYGIQIEER